MNDLFWTIARKCANGNCVTIAIAANGDVVVGDTKNPDKEPHSFTPEEWDAFIGGVKSGEFDRSALRQPTAV